jgi:ketosteroid isomerase-like protein
MTEHERTARDFFLAMQTGASAEAEMMALFADDAEYVEPFSGRAVTHTGKPAIRDVMRHGWSRPLPDMRIEVDRLHIEGEAIVADWTCHSAGLPGGRGSGRNVFTLRDGRIVRLETTLRTPER